MCNISGTRKCPLSMSDEFFSPMATTINGPLLCVTPPDLGRTDELQSLRAALRDKQVENEQLSAACARLRETLQTMESHATECHCNQCPRCTW